MNTVHPQETSITVRAGWRQSAQSGAVWEEGTFKGDVRNREGREEKQSSQLLGTEN